YNNRVVSSSGGVWATSTAGTANNATCWMVSGIIPASGQVYEWYYAVPCAGAMATPTIGSTSATVCTGQPVNVTTTFGALPLLNVTYQWMQSSSPSGPFTNVSGGT